MLHRRESQPRDLVDLGQRGLATKYLAEEMDPKADPLSPENKLIFATGPLTGTGAPTGGRPTAVAFVWRFDTSTVHLSYFDFYTRSMAFEDPNFERDVLTPYYKTRRNNAQFLPRRMLIRFHNSAREDLIGPDCRSLDP